MDLYGVEKLLKMSHLNMHIPPIISFPRCLQPISVTVIHIVAINVLEPHVFNFESQSFIPLFNKFLWLCGQHLGGDETSNEGCKSSTIGQDFMDNFVVKFV
jgi:ureidoglycolate hydrolase